RRTSPAYAALTQPQPLTADAVQRELLDDQTVLLQYSLGPDASYLWAVERDRIASYRLPAGAQIAEVVRDLRALVTAKHDAASDAQVGAAAERLGAMVVGPAIDRLAGKRVAVVADGALESVPFAMLVVPARAGAMATPLVAQNDLVTVPSVS